MMFAPPRCRLKHALSKVPRALLVFAIALAAFVYGGLVGKYRIFPYSVISDGVKTARTLNDVVDTGRFRRFSEVSPEQAAMHRIEFLANDGFDDPVLWYGGLFQFLDLCPGSGCLAVAYRATGEVAHVWPLRLHELEQAAMAGSDDDFPYELAPAFSFAMDVVVVGIAQYANGDLLVVFQFRNSFPYGGGVARIDREGHPVWFRRDYSHHWPYMLDADVALVPGFLVGEGSFSFESGEGTLVLDCKRGKPYLDTVNFISGNGHLLKRINLLDAFVESPYVQVLKHRVSLPEASCNPLHLNFIHRIGESAGAAWGMEPGDLVVSLRNLSAFAILDGESGRIKRLVRGSFAQQHGVRHFEGSTFLMFDNHGGNGRHRPSRLLMIDISDGRETTVFPNDRTPEPLRGLFTDRAGSINISPDRKRVMVVFSNPGVAIEVRLADGEALNVFTNLHDVSSLDQFGGERHTKAAIFEMKGLDYLRRKAGIHQAIGGRGGASP